MTDIDTILVDKFNKMNLLDIDNKIKKIEDVDELTNLISTLTISENVPQEYKKIIFHWLGIQYHTINKKLLESEQPPLLNFY
tara:strand:- start:1058 stop:1303 length:246 start_codon:yes stop_codon:yes gene_type:complete